MSGIYTTYTQQEPREFEDAEGTYSESVPVLRCSLCEEEIEDADSHEVCLWNVFYGIAEVLIDGGVSFYQRRVLDGYQLWENDTLLLLAQGQLSLKGLNARVRKIYERDRPGFTFKGYGFGFSFTNDGPFDGVGRISASNPKIADALAEALQDLAMQLDAGKYTAEVSWA
ncbi:hypothetical protein AB0P00_13570 [Microbacterium sp. NPDC077057]|uniref:hypothetical protein n=1 Tax=Microbacterium sp. NPDC077057 TaxID=3154763 RepID=UPI0034153112